jgi:retinol dehydrogenase-12
MKGIQFNTTTDIPSLEGKVVLVTGGNSGLGKHSILELAKHNPTEIWLGTRNINRGQEAVDEIKRQLPSAPPIKILQMDLSSLGSVREAAKTFCEQSQRLDLLLLNAGI